MLKYYWGLVRRLPDFFRGTVEAYLFWVAGALSLVASVVPGAAQWLANTPQLPRWVAPVALGVVFVYGLLRVNFDHQERQASRIADLEAFPPKTYLLLCHFRDRFDEIGAMPLVSDSDREACRVAAREAWNQFVVQVIPRLRLHEQSDMRSFASSLNFDTAKIPEINEAIGRLWSANEHIKMLVQSYCSWEPQVQESRHSPMALLSKTEEP